MVLYSQSEHSFNEGTIPWAQMSADRIKEDALMEGGSLPLDQDTMPADLYQVLSKGLQENHEHGDLDLQEIQDVFHRIKVFEIQIHTTVSYPPHSEKY